METITNCPPDSVLESFVNCDLSEADCTRLEEHLSTCAKCRQKVTELEKNQGFDFVLQSSQKISISGVSTAERLAKVALEKAEWLQLPQVIGPYLLSKRLGHGGMGEVYEAEHQILRRKFAIKFIRPKFLLNPSSLERFQHEILAAGKLIHPNVVSATDAGVFNESPFLVMEFLEGETLASYVERQGGKISLKEALNIVLQSARGLGFAHRKGLIHCDVKPSNLWRLPDGTIKVLDLGLAYASEELEDLSTHPILGTPNFMAPEQGVAHAKIDARTDVFGLGCVLFYLLTGLTQNDCVCRSIEFPNLQEAGVLVSHKVQKFLNSMTKMTVSKRMASMENVCREIEILQKPAWLKLTLWAGILLAVLGTSVTGTRYWVENSPKSEIPVTEQKKEKIPSPESEKTPPKAESSSILTSETETAPKPESSGEETVLGRTTETPSVGVKTTDSQTNNQTLENKNTKLHSTASVTGTNKNEDEKKPQAEPTQEKLHFWNLDWWKQVGKKGAEKLHFKKSASEVKTTSETKKDSKGQKVDSGKQKVITPQTQKKTSKAKSAVPERTGTTETKPKITEESPLTDAQIFYRKGTDWMQKEAEKLEPDPEFLRLAIENFEKSRKLGNSEATLRLWELCWLRRYEAESPSELTQEVLKMAEEGNLDAIQDVGYEFWFGRLGERSPEKAVQWFQKAVDSGEESECVHDCLMMLGKACESGVGVKKNPEKALELYQKATLSPDAQCAVGIAYLTGKGVSKDESKAVEIFKKYAEFNAVAAYMTGYCGENHLGGEMSMRLILEYYHRAHEIDENRASRGFTKTLEVNGLKEFTSELYRQAILKNLHSL